MCWSLEASAFAFVWCVSSSLYIHNRRASPRDAWTWKFLLAYGLVQLCDALFWSIGPLERHNPSSDKPLRVCTLSNQILSEYVLPIVLTLAVATQIHQAIEHVLSLRSNSNVSTITRGKWATAAFTLFVLTGPRRFHLYWGEPPYCTTLLDGRTLLWGDRPATKGLGHIWVIGGTLVFSLPFLVMKPVWIGIMYSLIGVMSSYIVYWIEPVAWGSNWCFVAISFSIVFVLEPTMTSLVARLARKTRVE